MKRTIEYILFYYTFKGKKSYIVLYTINLIIFLILLQISIPKEVNLPLKNSIELIINKPNFWIIISFFIIIYIVIYAAFEFIRDSMELLSIEEIEEKEKIRYKHPYYKITKIINYIKYLKKSKTYIKLYYFRNIFLT